MPTLDRPALAPRMRPRAALLALLAALALGALALHGPIAQPAHYHAFADARAWLGIPNAANVLSNLPFAVIGIWGLVALRRCEAQHPARSAWRLLCTALVATAAGSALYHWAPHDTTLVLDRIPIAWACVAVLAAFFAERGWRAAGRTRTLGVLFVVATAAVLYWWWTERQGNGDLRPYLALHLLPMLLVPAALLLRLPRSHRDAAPDTAWWGLLLFYAAAKAVELTDAAIFDALGSTLSGHTLKHLLAAAGAAWLLRGVVAAMSGRRS